MTTGSHEARWANYIVTESGCWEWQGYVAENGYGRVYDRERPRGQRIQWVHRAFYERLKEPIGLGLELDHTCTNTICVNPDHLDQVTRKEHIARTLARLGKDDRHLQAAELRIKGLTYEEIAVVLGFAHKASAMEAIQAAIRKGLVDADAVPRPRSLSEIDRGDVRELYAFGVPQTEIAAWYGVDSSHISRICNRQDRRSKRRKDAAA